MTVLFVASEENENVSLENGAGRWERGRGAPLSSGAATPDSFPSCVALSFLLSSAAAAIASPMAFDTWLQLIVDSNRLD